MLSKRVIGKEDIISRQVSCHAVRPVEHFHFHEDKFLPISNINGIPCLYHLIIPFRMVILTGKRFYPVSRTVNRGGRNLLHQCRKGTAVIHFSVVGYNKIDFL